MVLEAVVEVESDEGQPPRIHAGQVVAVDVADDTMTIDPGGDDPRTMRRTTAQAVRNIKAFRPRGRQTGTQEAAAR